MTPVGTLKSIRSSSLAHCSLSKQPNSVFLSLDSHTHQLNSVLQGHRFPGHLTLSVNEGHQTLSVPSKLHLQNALAERKDILLLCISLPALRHTIKYATSQHITCYTLNHSDSTHMFLVRSFSSIQQVCQGQRGKAGETQRHWPSMAAPRPTMLTIPACYSLNYWCTACAAGLQVRKTRHLIKRYLQCWLQRRKRKASLKC